MITRFKASGIIGVPDCDISFNDAKMIVVQGPNGSGKSSLLNYITHPFRTIDNSALVLKDDVNEGFLESYFTFKNNHYRVLHTSRRMTNRFECKTYIQKMINNKYVDMVDDGSVQKANNYIAQEFNLNRALHPLLNVGTGSFGFLSMSNADRLSIMKKLLRLEQLEGITKIVEDKAKVAKTESRVYEKMLKDSPDIKVLETNLSNHKNQLKVLELSINKTKKEIKDITENEIAYKNYVDLYKNIESVPNKVRIIIDTLNKLNHEENFKSLIDHYRFDSFKIENLIKSNDDRIFTLMESIKKVDKTDEETLIKHQNDLLEYIQKEESDFVYEEYYDNVDTNEYKQYLSAIASLGMGDSKNDVADALQDIQAYKNNLTINKNNLLDIKLKIQNLKLEYDKYTYQDNIVSLIPHEKTPKECPLRQEWEKQINNRDKHNEIQSNLNSLDNDYNELAESVAYCERVLNFANYIYNLEKPKCFDNIFTKGYRFVSQDYTWDQAKASLVSIKLAQKKKENIKEYKTNLKVIQDKLDLITKMSKNEISNMENEINELLTKQKENKEKLTSLKQKLKELDNLVLKYEITDDLMKLPVIELMELEDKMIKTCKEYKEQLEKLRTVIENQRAIQTKIDEYEKDKSYIISEISKTETTLNQIKNVEVMFKTISEDKTILTNIREILKQQLLVRTLEPNLRQIENVVNSLLDGFMSMKFIIEEGNLDIECERDGITRSSKVLSNGETSILGIALMMAIKNYIDWDIISIDEGSATLDEQNKQRFIYMLRDFASVIPNISQMFIVSHDTIVEEGMGLFKINIENGNIITS